MSWLNCRRLSPKFRVPISGVFSVGDPPVPIPNTVVKLYCGEDTEGKSLWENSATPEFMSLGPPPNKV